MFLRQTNGYDCAPISLINYMQYLGLPWDGRHLSLVRYIMNTHIAGTHILDLMFAVETLMPRTQIGFTRSGKRVISYMKKKGPVIVAYSFEHEGNIRAHVAFCYYEKGVIVTNAVQGVKFNKITEQGFCNLIKNSISEPAFIYLKE